MWRHECVFNELGKCRFGVQVATSGKPDYILVLEVLWKIVFVCFSQLSKDDTPILGSLTDGIQKCLTL
jgi:hypothetical protein